MKRPKEITEELKKSNSPLLEYVKLLEKENLKLHTRIEKLQVENISYQNEATVAKKSRPAAKIIIQTSPEVKKLMEE